MQKHCFA